MTTVGHIVLPGEFDWELINDMCLSLAGLTVSVMFIVLAIRVTLTLREGKSLRKGEKNDNKRSSGDSNTSRASSKKSRTNRGLRHVKLLNKTLVSASV